MLVCEKNKCVGCGACLYVCGKDAIKIVDSMEAFNAVVDTDKCIECGRCKKVCQVQNTIELTPVSIWKQGWAREKCIRENSASGGVASAIIAAFISGGGKVFACQYSNIEHLFIIDDVSRSNLEYKVPGSKYVKSIAYKAYTKVKEALLNNDRVLFIGLPCQVYALKQVIPSKYHENLFTIDLICHGTPSQLLLKKYCEEYNLKEVNDIKFRAKKKSKVNDIYRPITPFGVADSFLISFVKSINYYECCYECKFAGIRRCSDLTLGDSWGSELSNEEIEKGISLLLVQSQKGEELIGAADLYLEDVNIEKAIKYNAQLRAPEKMPVIRDIFFENISAGRKYDWAVFKCYPLLMIKQSIKKCLLRMKLYHFNGDAKYKILINRKDQMSD